jgi:hypothetical protein
MLASVREGWEDKGNYCDDGQTSYVYIGMFGSLLGFVAVKAMIVIRQSDVTKEPVILWEQGKQE